jgi:hypothetical protein
MASTIIKIKQSAIAGKIPSASSLTQGELALNTADKKLYSKDATGAVFEISSGSGGGGGVAASSEINTYEHTATANQATFSAFYNPTNDHVNVFYNGMKLLESDFTATSGTTIVLIDPADVDDLVTVEVIKAINLANGSNITEYEFIATAGQTTFNWPSGYDKVSDNIEVYVNGIKLLASTDFTFGDNVNVVLVVAADLDDEVVVKHIKIIALTASHVLSTDKSAVIPAGTTADRDVSPEAGYLRWNTDLNTMEVYDGTTWEDDNDHTHAISDTTGLQAELDGKATMDDVIALAIALG